MGKLIKSHCKHCKSVFSVTSDFRLFFMTELVFRMCGSHTRHRLSPQADSYSNMYRIFFIIRESCISGDSKHINFWPWFWPWPRTPSLASRPRTSPWSPTATAFRPYSRPCQKLQFHLIFRWRSTCEIEIAHGRPRSPWRPYSCWCCCCTCCPSGWLNMLA